MTAARDRGAPGLGPPRPGLERRAVVLGGAVVVLVVAAGLWIRHTRGGLGTASPPFVMDWHPRADLPWAVLAVVVAAAVLAAARVLLRPSTPSWVVGTGTALVALVLGLAANAARIGPYDWIRSVDLGPRGAEDAVNQYLPGLRALGFGRGFYLDRFAEIVPSQPVNIGGHGPFPLLLMDLLGIDGPRGLAALCVAGVVLTPPLVLRLGLTLGDARSARIAAMLCATSPATILFGVTTFDAVFMAIGALAAVLLVGPAPADGRAPGARAVVAGLAGAAVLAVGTGFTWALLGVGVWAVLVVLQRRGLRPAAAAAVACAVVLGAMLAALAAGYGYDPVGTLRATERLYRDSVSQQRPWSFWVLGSPTAWVVMLGLPVAAAVVRAAIRGGEAARALVLVIAIAAVAGFTKAETERIWLIFVPLACVAAAPVVARWRVERVLAVALAQIIVVELLFDTVW